MIINSSQIEKNDKELYKEFLLGNNEAFNIIIQRYRTQLISFIMKYTKNFEVSEDLAQDTFVYILVNRKDYDFKYSLKTYLYTIAKCRALNYLKKQKRIISYEDYYDYEQSIEYDLDMKLIQQERKQRLYESLKKLKQEYQIAIYLADFQGFKYNEISRILEKTLPQTKMLIHRARKSLEKNLKKEGKIC